MAVLQIFSFRNCVDFSCQTSCEVSEGNFGMPLGYV